MRVLTALLSLLSLKMEMGTSLSVQISTTNTGVSKLHLDQQAAKTRRAMIEQTLLKPGIELDERIFKLKAPTGTGFSQKSSNNPRQLLAQERAKLIRSEVIIELFFFVFKLFISCFFLYDDISVGGDTS